MSDPTPAGAPLGSESTRAVLQLVRTVRTAVDESRIEFGRPGLERRFDLRLAAVERQARAADALREPVRQGLVGLADLLTDRAAVNAGPVADAVRQAASALEPIRHGAPRRPGT